MSEPYLLLVHVVISLAGIASGFGIAAGFVAGKFLPRWTDLFLVTTAATSATGFFFPFRAGFTPAMVLGVISLLALAVAAFALYVRRLQGGWRSTFVIASVLSLYLNFFVLVVQLFKQIQDLHDLAPNQNEPPFAITQGLVLLAFVWLGFAAVRGFRDPLASAQPTR